MANFLDKIIEVTHRLRAMRPVGMFNGGGTNENDLENHLPISPTWFVNSPHGQPRGVNILEVRQFAASCWTKMIIRYIRDRFLTTPFSFVNVDEEDENDYKELRKKALDFFMSKNSNNEDIIETLLPVITDLAEIDAGVLVKRYSRNSYTNQTVEFIDELGRPTGETQTMLMLKPLGQRELNELWYADGSTFLKQMTVHRQLMGYFQYSWKYPNAQPVFFERDEVSYWAKGQDSYRTYGFSPLQTIQQVVEVLIQSTRWNKDFFKNNAIPNGIMSLEGLDPEDIKKVKHSWQNEFKGKPHKILIHNGKADYKPLLLSAREMEWLEGQQWYMHLCFGAYGISPEEVGFTQDTHGKNVQDGQAKTSAKNGIEPYFKYAERRLYNDIMPDVLGMANPPIKLVFDHQDTEKQTREHAQGMEKVDRHVYTINELRAKEGLDAVEWGDQPVEIQQAEKQQAADAKNKPQPTTNSNKTYATAFEKYLEKKQ